METHEESSQFYPPDPIILPGGVSRIILLEVATQVPLPTIVVTTSHDQ